MFHRPTKRTFWLFRYADNVVQQLGQPDQAVGMIPVDVSADTYAQAIARAKELCPPRTDTASYMLVQISERWV